MESLVLRLAECDRCGARHRALEETGGRLRGRCLGCGETLPGPLDVERCVITVAGRGGQVIATAA
jgi:hypothetical protein